MRVLVLGMPRTGTTSICLALRKLGYNPHQMIELLRDPDQLPLWQEAVNLTLLPSSQNSLPPYGKPEFDKLLGNYDAVADIPGAVFSKELVEAYPDAKVILTIRDYKEWEESMQNSIWLLLKWRLFVLCRKLNVTQMAPLTRLMHSVFEVHNGNHYEGPEAKIAYERHYERVKELVPRERLLEIDTRQTSSWDPLVRFLGVEKPDNLGPYPNVEENKAMANGLESAWWSTIKWMLLMFFVSVAAIIGAVGIYWQKELWEKFEGILKMLEPYARLRPREE